MRYIEQIRKLQHVHGYSNEHISREQSAEF